MALPFKKDIEDGDFRRQRRTLMIVSILLCVYIIGDGSIVTTDGIASLHLPFGIKLHFGRDDLLEYLLLFSVLVSMLRYFITTQAMRKNMVREVEYSLEDLSYFFLTAPSSELNSKTKAKLNIKNKFTHWQMSYKNKNDSFEPTIQKRWPFSKSSFIAWWAEIKLAMNNPVYLECYIPFIVAWASLVLFAFRVG